jgi:hypothetical protein
VLQAAGVVEMQVAYDHGFDVFDVIARGFYCSGELLLVAIADARKDVC